MQGTPIRWRPGSTSGADASRPSPSSRFKLNSDAARAAALRGRALAGAHWQAARRRPTVMAGVGLAGSAAVLAAVMAVSSPATGATDGWGAFSAAPVERLLAGDERPAVELPSFASAPGPLAAGNRRGERIAPTAAQQAINALPSATALAASQFKMPTLSLDKLTHPQAEMARWLAKRYQMAPQQIATVVQEAWNLGQRASMDPTLILAIIGVESSFNPLAQSPVGAQGLMQVHTPVHQDKFRSLGGLSRVFDPRTNLTVGIQILKDSIARGGSVAQGLKVYSGAANLPTDFGYATKVMTEQNYLLAVKSGQAVSPTAPAWRPGMPTLASTPAPAAEALSTAVAERSDLPAATIDAATRAQAASEISTLIERSSTPASRPATNPGAHRSSAPDSLRDARELMDAPAAHPGDSNESAAASQLEDHRA